MDKPTAKQFRKDFDKAVEELSEKYEANIELGNIRFTDTQLTSKVTVTEITEGVREIDARFVEKLRTHGHKYGLSADSYGERFEHNGDTFELVGVKPRATKYPIVARKISDGGLYKLTQQAIRALDARIA